MWASQPLQMQVSPMVERQSKQPDLELNQPQSETVYLSDGRTAEIGIRPASAIRPLWDSYYDNASGNWEILQLPYNLPPFLYHY